MRNIPFSPPDISQAEIDEVVKVVRSGWITTGPETKLFESRIAKYCNVERAACLSSQTSCAELTLRILGVGPGDEVILPAYTYTATASIVYHVGAKPVMIDCKSGSFEMDYDKMEAAINHNTKAIIAVDLAGIICDYDRIFEAAERRKSVFEPKNELQEKFGRVFVISDGAHAFGAMREGRMCGEIADFTNFSFHAVKNMTTAEGGAAVHRSHPAIDEDWMYKQYMLLSLHGQTKAAYSKSRAASWEYDVVDTQYKCNMPDVLAALGVAQLSRYDKILERRHELIRLYNEELKDLPIQVLNHCDDHHRSSGHLYFVRFIGKNDEYRNKFYTTLAEIGVMCNAHFKPLPLLTAYSNKGFRILDFPNAYNMHKNQLTLPLNTVISDEYALYVQETFKRTIKTI